MCLLLGCGAGVGPGVTGFGTGVLLGLGFIVGPPGDGPGVRNGDGVGRQVAILQQASLGSIDSLQLLGRLTYFWHLFKKASKYNDYSYRMI